MSFAFATCDRNRALDFMKKLYPSKELSDSPESLGDFLDIIQADELRVCDPSFHGGQIIESVNFGPTTAQRAMDALNKAGVSFGRV